jgi:holo-[acyl-carrier protein] synthase
MAGVGIDLLEIDRMERALARRPRLAERLFTPGERAEAARRGRQAQYFASRFCAKEAVVKALALESWNPHEIEIVGGGDGPPRVRLSGDAAHRAATLGVDLEISITHSRTMAGAMAVTR